MIVTAPLGSSFQLPKVVGHTGYVDIGKALQELPYQAYLLYHPGQLLLQGLGAQIPAVGLQIRLTVALGQGVEYIHREIADITRVA
jgi:hypothetical protein